MIVRDITDFLEGIAPLSLQESYDNAGLLIGDHEQFVHGALICLDVTEDVIDEAVNLGCNLIIAHHPVIFRGLKRLNGYHHVERSVIKAIRNHVNIYAIHTNLDHILQNGVNEALAAKIGLINLRILKPLPGQENTGSGIIGQLPEKTSFENFTRQLANRLNLEVIKSTRVVHNPVDTIALCGGSGSFLLPEAIVAGAQLFLSADFKYHDYFESNDRITILDIGHYESEKSTIELLHRLISEKFPNFAACCTKINTNPIKYLTYVHR